MKSIRTTDVLKVHLKVDVCNLNDASNKIEGHIKVSQLRRVDREEKLIIDPFHCRTVIGNIF